MSTRAVLQFLAGLLLALIGAVAAQAVSSPAPGRNELVIVHTSDAGSEIAPCG